MMIEIRYLLFYELEWDNGEMEGGVTMVGTELRQRATERERKDYCRESIELSEYP